SEGFKRHSQNEKFQCPNCSKVFCYKFQLKSHLHVHSQSRPFECSVCGLPFKTRCNLNRHLNVHAGKRFECTTCDATFSCQSGLSKHVKKVHKNSIIKKHICEVCSKAVA